MATIDRTQLTALAPVGVPCASRSIRRIPGAHRNGRLCTTAVSRESAAAVSSRSDGNLIAIGANQPPFLRKSRVVKIILASRSPRCVRCPLMRELKQAHENTGGHARYQAPKREGQETPRARAERHCPAGDRSLRNPDLTRPVRSPETILNSALPATVSHHELSMRAMTNADTCLPARRLGAGSAPRATDTRSSTSAAASSAGDAQPVNHLECSSTSISRPLCTQRPHIHMLEDDSVASSCEL